MGAADCVATLLRLVGRQSRVPMWPTFLGAKEKLSGDLQNLLVEKYVIVAGSLAPIYVLDSYGL